MQYITVVSNKKWKLECGKPKTLSIIYSLGGGGGGVTGYSYIINNNHYTLVQYFSLFIQHHTFNMS